MKRKNKEKADKENKKRGAPAPYIGNPHGDGMWGAVNEIPQASGNYLKEPRRRPRHHHRKRAHKSTVGPIAFSSFMKKNGF